ncbi:C-C motif chemokine 20-like [Anguilla anguilla]|uniref:Chemokine interleukin-8-like domain-containing protein n=1 Tax=Anguilla anguilla TaxID=7936 RepID=A0A0E9WIW9_ANGAN|nr:C-C motif chemokine 20-like [Anguilla anguilla]KAG5847296.1 hypothetical protein ANANG_G00124520 [Anguilla anguilla]
MHNIWKCTMLVILLACGITAQLSKLRRPNKGTISCCQSVSKMPITYGVTGYKQQKANGRCVDAIIFYTEKGEVCSHPEAHWVKKKMNEVPMIP